MHDRTAQALVEERDRNGYTKKLYKAEADSHKGETLKSNILAQLDSLKEVEEKDKVNFRDISDVKRRTYSYFVSCATAEVYPSVMGLAVHGFGISRQALNQWLQRNSNTETAEFIEQAKDVMADILTNAGLYNNANSVQVLFQLKNHFGHADKVELTAIPTTALGRDLSIEDIQASLELSIPSLPPTGE